MVLLLLLWIPIPSSSCALWMAITRTVRKMVWVLGKGFFTGLVRMSIPWICCCGMYVSLQNPILCCMILSCWTCSWERLKQEHYYKIEAFVVARVLFNANKSRVWNHLCFYLQIKSKQSPLRFSFVISRQTHSAILFVWTKSTSAILSCILSSNWGTVWYISELQEKNA